MKIMTYSIDVVVTEVIVDFDPYGGEYVKVAFGYKLPVPFRPPKPSQPVPTPQVVAYKHALHLFIPKDQWKAQYNLWQEFHLIVRDDGNIELKPKR